MLKDIDDRDKEPARKRAERRWRNYDVERRFKSEKNKSDAEPKKPKELELAVVIETAKITRGSITRAQTKFAKELKAMLEGNTERNAAYYRASLEHKRKRLLVEKLRRLRATQEIQT